MLDLPTTPAILLRDVIETELAGIPADVRDPRALTFVIAAAVQETGLKTRQQDGGPAHSLWQFELNGVHAVLVHPRTWALAEHVCSRHGLKPDALDVYKALLTDDGLGAAFARLLLWTDPYALPADAGEGWSAYLRLWRPGKPDIARWPRAWRLAQEALEQPA